MKHKNYYLLIALICMTSLIILPDIGLTQKLDIAVIQNSKQPITKLSQEEKFITGKKIYSSNNFYEPTLIISILALLFTIFSFWWMNWRKGKLIVGAPRSFATCSDNSKYILFHFPFVFYNKGAASQIIQNLRLVFYVENDDPKILYFNSTIDDLGVKEDSKWARQFAIEGRKSYSHIFEFLNSDCKFIFSADKHCATLEAKVDDNKDWTHLLTFDIQSPESKISLLNTERLQVYDNDPDRYKAKV